MSELKPSKQFNICDININILFSRLSTKRYHYRVSIEIVIDSIFELYKKYSWDELGTHLKIFVRKCKNDVPFFLNLLNRVFAYNIEFDNSSNIKNELVDSFASGILEGNIFDYNEQPNPDVCYQFPLSLTSWESFIAV